LIQHWQLRFGCFAADFGPIERLHAGFPMQSLSSKNRCFLFPRYLAAAGPNLQYSAVAAAVAVPTRLAAIAVAPILPAAGVVEAVPIRPAAVVAEVVPIRPAVAAAEAVPIRPAAIAVDPILRCSVVVDPILRCSAAAPNYYWSAVPTHPAAAAAVPSHVLLPSSS
jgi:hypothetical protein